VNAEREAGEAMTVNYRELGGHSSLAACSRHWELLAHQKGICNPPPQQLALGKRINMGTIYQSPETAAC
jgi:hypothetical protein